MAPKASKASATKKAVIKDGALEVQARKIMANVASRDLVYVMEQLTDDGSMASLIAELLRDGTLQRVLRGTPLTEACLKGRQPPMTSTKWRHIKAPLAKKVLQALLGNGPNYAKVAKCIAENAQDSTTDEMADLVKFALNVQPGDNLPNQYKDWRNEEMCFNLCRARAEQLGNRLDNIGMDGYLSYGFFSICEDDVTRFRYNLAKDPTKSYSLGVTTDMMKDYTLHNNFCIHGYLRTKRGLQIHILEVLKEHCDMDEMPMPTGDWKLTGFEINDDDKNSVSGSSKGSDVKLEGGGSLPSEPTQAARVLVGTGLVTGAVPPAS